MAKLLAENQGITEILSKGKLAFFFFWKGKLSWKESIGLWLQRKADKRDYIKMNFYLSKDILTWKDKLQVGRNYKQH